MARDVPAILFDLDGTLVDSTDDLVAAVNHARAGVGLAPLSTGEVRGFIGDGMQVLLQRSIGDAALVPRAIELFRAHYGAHLLDRTRAYDGVEAMLDALAPLKLAVVTNKPEGFSRAILEGTGLARHFRAVVGSDSGFGRKPERRPFDAALAMLSFKPGGASDSLVVGDGRNDVLGARAAGLRVCGVGWGIGDPEEIRALGPNYWIDAPGQLPGLLQSAASGRPT